MYRRIVLVTLFTLLIGVAIVLAALLLTVEKQTQVSKSDLSTAIEANLADNHRLISQLLACDQSVCEITKEIENVEASLKAVESAIANEKKSLSTVGSSAFQMLKLAIIRYNNTRDRPTLLLETNYLTNEIALLAATLRENAESESHDNVTDLLHRVYLLGLCILALFVSLITLLFHYTQLANREQKRLERSLLSMSHHCSESDAEQIAHNTIDSEITPVERGIYTSFNKLLTEVEASRRNEDIFRQLYGFIGYEIRSISNTINGGVKLLIQETDESSVVLAKDITTATDALSDLADNYNKLLSVGAHDGGQIIDIGKLFIGLGVNLSHKAKENACSFDCYLPVGLPEFAQGNFTKIFWSLLLSFSNAIQSVEHSSALLTCQLEESESIESIRISFQLTFLTSAAFSYAQLQAINWQSTTESYGTNNAAVQLIDHRHAPQQLWSTSSAGKMLSISIETTPKRYFSTNDQFADKRVLICGDDNIQTSIINQVLDDLKITTSVVRTPNEIFRTLKSAQTLDAIIISDTMNGIKLRSFCKTLKSRLEKAGHTKLILSISDPQPFEEGYEMVDKIIQHPFTTIEFAQKVEQVLTEVEDQQEADSRPLLIVEDDKVQQFILKQMLTKQGYDCVCANDGLSAVKIIQEQAFDIVFMDCIMPGLDGFEATKRIRQLEADERVSAVTIIGATALSSNSEHKACIDAGMDYVISKPYNAEQIFKVIKKYAALQKIS
ncbi:response regulator [Thaumasiovibrio subtropicus]|uniref:response regulator n=1 Tax=Thaumasiovibrio subtropicus TaxID=1891207 RepID=UPI000B364633|nr:response regulator [Thaumasiovibrio subtropicus]